MRGKYYDRAADAVCACDIEANVANLAARATAAARGAAYALFPRPHETLPLSPYAIYTWIDEVAAPATTAIFRELDVASYPEDT